MFMSSTLRENPELFIQPKNVCKVIWPIVSYLKTVGCAYFALVNINWDIKEDFEMEVLQNDMVLNNC